MPIQIDKDRYIQFTFNPDYYKSKKWQAKRTEPSEITKNFTLNIQRSNIVLDGGNVVKAIGKR